MSEEKSTAAEWYVYIIRCSDGRLYTGITNDVERRVLAHASGRGAKFFRGRKPLAIVYLEDGHDRASASRREAAIKRLDRAGKDRIIAAHGPDGGEIPIDPA